MLRSHFQAGAESIAAYAARTTDVCSKAYAGFSTDSQLSLAVDHFIAGLVDATSRDYLLHDLACRALTWQETVQMAHSCKASRLSLHSTTNVADAASATSNAPSPNERTCANAENTVAPAWKQSARDGRAKASAHLSRKLNENSRAHANKQR